MTPILSPHVALDAYYRFLADDGWAISSHIALSALMALFPFIILVTTLAASSFGSNELADEVATLLLEAWPDTVARPIAREIHNVLTTKSGEVVTLGAVFSVYFSSNGIESLRIGLTRAYGVQETRSWFLLRLESIGYVLIAAISLLALAFLIVLGPLAFSTAIGYAPALAPLEWDFTVARYAVTTFILVIALVIAHKWLPPWRRQFVDVLPGIVVTLALWLASSILFGHYLAAFSSTYVSYYAGLASVMIALVYLYFAASIFVYGGELNSAIGRARQRKNCNLDDDDCSG